jgi:hypothetical protein
MPRLQVSVILLLTGLAGFLTSFLLLHLGISRMWLRYPIAIAVAYCVFLLLLHLWLWLQRGRKLDPPLDVPGPDLLPDALPRASESLRFGGGGDFGGGGAGGSWEGGPSSSSGVSADSVSDAVSFDVDLETGWLVVLAIVALIGGLVASFYIIYIAPALLAEIIVDGILMVGLFKRMKRIDRRHWLQGALRQTILPAILVGVLFTVAGYVMQRAVPEAQSIGEVWNWLLR